MAKSPTYELVTLTAQGAMPCRVVLGQRIAAGGAGTVFEAQGDPSTVIKIYHDSSSAKDLANSQCQIQAMIKDPPDLPPFQYQGRAYVQIAWPTALLMRDGKFAGFSMPVLEMNRTKVLEWLLLDKQAMKAGLRCDMGTRVTVARQLAGVVSALHKKGHYVVDMKPVNLSYYPDTLYMAVLDCDGFNIHDDSNGTSYPAPMFTAEYLAPEFQILGANPNTDPKAQDKFALAVIIFQLLSHGVHPYTGVLSDRRLSSEMKDRISRGDFPYGRQPNPNCAPIPASTYRCLPDELIDCFERAFERDPARRPSAQEWTNRLEKYATPSTNNLVQCKSNPEHRHFAGLPCSRCMLDRFSSGQAGAPASRQSTPQRISTSSSTPPAIPRPPPLPPAVAPPNSPPVMVWAPRTARSYPTKSKSNSVARRGGFLSPRNVGLSVIGLIGAVGIAFYLSNPTETTSSGKHTSPSHAPAKSLAPPKAPGAVLAYSKGPSSRPGASPISAGGPAAESPASQVSYVSPTPANSVAQPMAGADVTQLPSSEPSMAPAHPDNAELIGAIIHAAEQNDWETADAHVEYLKEHVPPIARGDRMLARRLNAQGLDFLGRHNFVSAIGAFTSAHQADPADIEVNNNLGTAYQQAGQNTQAVEALDRTLIYSPVRSTAWESLARVYAQAGELAASEACARLTLRYSKSPPNTITYMTSVVNANPEGPYEQILAKVLGTQPSAIPRVASNPGAATAFPQPSPTTTIQPNPQLLGAVRGMLTDGRTCFTKKEYTCAITNATNVLRLMPSSVEAQSLRDRASAAQTEAMSNIDLH